MPARSFGLSGKRAPLAAVAAALVLLGVGGCGGSQRAEEARVQREIAAGTGMPAEVVCRPRGCVLTASARFHSRAEASYLALSPVSWVATDPQLEGVAAIVLRLHDARRAMTADFDCRLRRGAGSRARAGSATVTLVHRLCTLSVRPSAEATAARA